MGGSLASDCLHPPQNSAQHHWDTQVHQLATLTVDDGGGLRLFSPSWTQVGSHCDTCKLYKQSGQMTLKGTLVCSNYAPSGTLKESQPGHAVAVEAAIVMAAGTAVKAGTVVL
jgi:hypothetical protein